MRKRSGQVHSRESSATLQLTVSLLYRHRVVGIDEEAKVHYNNIDNLLSAFRERIDMEPISDELKGDLKNYEVITIQGKTLIVITITAASGQLYDNKKYVREGSELKEVTA